MRVQVGAFLGAMGIPLLLVGCAPSVPELLEGASAAVYPPEGSMAVRGELHVAVDLGVHAGLSPEVTVLSEDRQSGAGQRWEGDCTVDDAQNLASCYVMPDPPNGQDFDIEVWLGERQFRQSISSRVPPVGSAFALHDEAVVEHLGRSELLANVVRELIEDTPMVAALGGWQGGAFSGDLLGGLADEEGLDEQGRPELSIDSPGLTLVMPVRVDDAGALAGTTAELWMPIHLDGEVYQLRIKDVSLSGQATPEALLLDLEGALDAASLVRLIEGSGLDADSLLRLVKPDVDTDGDGQDDALSITLQLDSPAATLTSWTYM